MVDEATNAAMAHMKIEHHEKVCAERYGNIWDRLGSIETQFSTMHDRFNTISNRMWIAVTLVCGVAVLGLGARVFHLLTRR